ncbi:carboxylating nicotinate-nucleotide diphosphorylase, partial [Patescibacteria group bacterium]|nr:carboxylating nicotinate-nucleotide diphosphorylase [Patescibacteria group bacterium]
DITSETLVDPDRLATARVVSKSSGIFCGAMEARYFLSDKFIITDMRSDGELVGVEDSVLEFEGKARDVLAYERVLLNLIMRMSGVATAAKKFVDAAGDTLVVPTRKTLWGLLDKRACSVGGGGTHRLNLSDAVLIKDNHLDLSGRDIDKALNKGFGDPRFIEIEVENTDEAEAAFKAFEKIQGVPKVIMFDNMRPKEIAEFVKDHRGDVLFEASGGITLDNVKDYAETCVDVISTSAITMDARSLNFSLIAQ